MNERPSRRGAALGAVLATGVLVAACGSGSSNVVRPPGKSTPATTPITSASTVTSSSNPSSSAPSRAPTVSVTPAHGLPDRQVVHVVGSGFSANESLAVVQCASKGQSTGPGDCNLAALLSTTTDAGGRVAVDLPVLRGPFGANNIVCSKKQQCLVSVTQASLSPTEEADAVIDFAGG